MIRCFLVCCAVLFVLSRGAWAAPSASHKTVVAGGVENRVAVLVNNEAIFTSTLRGRLRFAAISLGMEPSSKNLETLLPSVRHAMVNEILQRQTAEKMGVTIENKAVEEVLQSIAAGNGMTPEGLAVFFKQNGIPLSVLTNQIRSNLLWRDYIQQKYMHSLSVTDQEIEAAQERLRKQQQKRYYDLAEIVLHVHEKADEPRIRNLASQVIGWLQNGAPFPMMAWQFSQSRSAAQGGRLGWVSEDDLESGTEKVLAKMPLQTLSAPIRTASGYVILALINRRDPDLQRAANIPGKDEITALLKTEHLERLAQRELAALRRNTPIEIRG